MNMIERENIDMKWYLHRIANALGGWDRDYSLITNSGCDWIVKTIRALNNKAQHLAMIKPLYEQLKGQIEQYYGKGGGLAALQDGHRRLSRENEGLREALRQFPFDGDMNDIHKWNVRIRVPVLRDQEPFDPHLKSIYKRYTDIINLLVKIEWCRKTPSFGYSKCACCEGLEPVHAPGCELNEFLTNYI